MAFTSKSTPCVRMIRWHVTLKSVMVLLKWDYSLSILQKLQKNMRRQANQYERIISLIMGRSFLVGYVLYLFSTWNFCSFLPPFYERLQKMFRYYIQFEEFDCVCITIDEFASFEVFQEEIHRVSLIKIIKWYLQS